MKGTEQADRKEELWSWKEVMFKNSPTTYFCSQKNIIAWSPLSPCDLYKTHDDPHSRKDSEL